MNGRVYDPLTARFLSVDPHVTDPTNGQSYNRYSYVLNNPTNLTDPTGFDAEKDAQKKIDAAARGACGQNLSCQKEFKDTLGKIANASASGGTGSSNGTGSSAPTSSGVEKAEAKQTHGSVNTGSSVFKDVKEGIASWWNSSVEAFKSESTADFAKRLVIDTPNPENAVVGIAGAVAGSIGKIEQVIVSGSRAEAAALRAAEAPLIQQGGLNLFKWGSETTTTATGWRAGDFMLHLPNRGSVRANWAQNSGRLREQMSKGQPIYDSFRDATSGLQIPTKGFLGAERNLLESRGWQYNPAAGAYFPPLP